jgi:polysaccharide export outer membrane protein
VIRLDTLFSDPSANIRLQGGDMFYVPIKEIQYFYVIGDVLQPGRREIQAGDSVLSVRALAMAGGPLKTAKLSEAVLVTRRPDGSVIHDEINLKNILVGKKQDFAMQPGQILFVPGSMSKSLGYGILNAAPMLVLF